MKKNGIVNGNKIKPEVTAVIQARMQSTRLPGKSMLDLGGKPLLAHIIERTKLIEGIDTVVLATCFGDENIPIIELAESMNIETFVGSVDNVLERFYNAVYRFGGDFVVRVTGDNPFLDIDYASMIVDIALESSFDLCALANLPLGAAVEVVKREALEEAYKASSEPYHFEHVTPYIKEHPELFSIERPRVDLKNAPNGLRLTVDTPEDYEFAQKLYNNLYNNKPFPLSNILEYIKEYPEIQSINNGIKQRSAKHAALGIN